MGKRGRWEPADVKEKIGRLNAIQARLWDLDGKYAVGQIELGDLGRQQLPLSKERTRLLLDLRQIALERGERGLADRMFEATQEQDRDAWRALLDRLDRWSHQLSQERAIEDGSAYPDPGAGQGLPVQSESPPESEKLVKEGYHDLTLEVTTGGSGNYEIKVGSRAGELTGIRAAFDPTISDVARAFDDISSHRYNAAKFQAWGRTLFEAVFPPPIEQNYRSALAIARDQKRGIRLRLRMSHPSWNALPWEFLYDPHPQEETHLAATPEVAIVRTPFVPRPIPPLRAPRPLRLLGVISAPTPKAPIDSDREKELICNTIKPLSSQIELQFLEPATRADLSEALRLYQPHAVHYIGHGTVRDNKAFLMLENQIDEHDFGDLFVGEPSVRMVVLNTCLGARSFPSRTFSGMAGALVRRGMPAVVAMQFRIRDFAAVQFSREIYGALAAGRPMDRAVAEARRSVRIGWGQDYPDWAAPVLYLGKGNSQAFL